LFRTVLIGEPKTTVESDAVALWADSSTVVSSTLVSPIVRHLVTLRCYVNEFAEEAELVEIRVNSLLHNVIATFTGEYSLDGSIRAIDIAGMYGESLNVRLGYADLSGTIYRIADVSLPMIVDDSGTFDP